MRIVSLNAWGGAMFAELDAWLPRCRADVLCLQEVTRTPGVGGATRFEDAERQLPQRANLFADVTQTMPRHQAMFVASDAGPVRTPDGVTHRQDFGLGIWIAEPITVVGQRAAFVHGDFVVHDEWAIDDRPRIALGVRLVEPGTQSGIESGSEGGSEDRPDRAVSVVHLHGLRDSTGKGDTPARRRQAERLAAFVDDLRRPGDLTIVAGDLNLLPDSSTFDVLREIGLTDLVRYADTRTARYTKPVRHANYLLVSDVDAVQRFEIVATPEVSDHRPLLIEV